MRAPSELPDPGPVADAPRGNWVDRFAPAPSRPYLRLSRADRPIGTWLLLIPCFWGVALAAATRVRAAPLATSGSVIACTIGAAVMRGAGCTWNDITDRHIDGAVARTRLRPIPSGQVSVRGALLWMAAQTAVGAALLFSFNSAAIALGLLSLIPVLIYPFAKRFTWWPQVFLGIAFNWGALLAWVAHTGSLTAAPVALYLSGIAWTLFYDTIYAHQDKEDDALIGVRSTARLFGPRTGRWLGIFLMATVSLMTLAVLQALLPEANPLKLALALAGPWGLGWHLLWQMRKLDIDNPEICLRVFRSNREAGLIAALFLAAAALA